MSARGMQDAGGRAASGAPLGLSDGGEWLFLLSPLAAGPRAARREERTSWGQADSRRQAHGQRAALRRVGGSLCAKAAQRDLWEECSAWVVPEGHAGAKSVGRRGEHTLTSLLPPSPIARSEFP